jgi:hypothetical protein
VERTIHFERGVLSSDTTVTRFHGSAQVGGSTSRKAAATEEMMKLRPPTLKTMGGLGRNASVLLAAPAGGMLKRGII